MKAFVDTPHFMAAYEMELWFRKDGLPVRQIHVNQDYTEYSADLKDGTTTGPCMSKEALYAAVRMTTLEEKK